MSQDVPNWFKQQYNDRVTMKFQSKGYKLMGTVMPEGSIEGDTAYFMVAGKGKARKKVRGQVAIPMNGSRGRVSTVLQTWEAFDEVFKYDVTRLGINERNVIEDSGAMALGRACDTEILGIVDAAAGTSAAFFVNDNANPFTLPKAQTMCQLLQAQDAPWDGNVFCPLPSLFWNQLLSWKQFNNSDYVGPDLPFTKVTVARSWNGVHWFLAPDELFPSKAANTLDIFLWHRNAMGWANNYDLQTIWDWDNRMGCWTVRMETEGAGINLLPEGIIRGRFASNSAITAN